MTRLKSGLKKKMKSVTTTTDHSTRIVVIVVYQGTTTRASAKATLTIETLTATRQRVSNRAEVVVLGETPFQVLTKILLRSRTVLMSKRMKSATIVSISLKRVMGLIALKNLEIITSEVLVVVLEYNSSV
jgi:hypothetical protein